jgi:hypothetical protein
MKPSIPLGQPYGHGGGRSVHPLLRGLPTQKTRFSRPSAPCFQGTRWETPDWVAN